MRYVAPTAEVRESFHQGTNRRAYEMLGAHPVEQDGIKLWHFAVWAPNAQQVYLTGEFCKFFALFTVENAFISIVVITIVSCKYKI